MACWNCILPNCKRWWALTWEERWTFFQALVLLPTTAVALRCIGVRRWQGFLLLGASPTSQDETFLSSVDRAEQKAKSTARMVAVASMRGLWRANCLERSIVLSSLLTRSGIPAQVHIGVQLETGRLAAHAWVSSRGVVLNDREDELRRFAAFDRCAFSPVAPVVGPPQERS